MMSEQWMRSIYETRQIHSKIRPTETFQECIRYNPHFENEISLEQKTTL